MLFVKSGMSAVLPTLFIGSKSDAKNLDFLLANRIFYILNVTPTRTEDPVAGVPNYFEKDGRFTCVSQHVLGVVGRLRVLRPQAPAVARLSLISTCCCDVQVPEAAHLR